MKNPFWRAFWMTWLIVGFMMWFALTAGLLLEWWIDPG